MPKTVQMWSLRWRAFCFRFLRPIYPSCIKKVSIFVLRLHMGLYTFLKCSKRMMSGYRATCSFSTYRNHCEKSYASGEYLFFYLTFSSFFLISFSLPKDWYVIFYFGHRLGPFKRDFDFSLVPREGCAL